MHATARRLRRRDPIPPPAGVKENLYSVPPDQSVPLASTGSSSALARPPKCHSRSTRICFGTPADKLANDGHDTRALQHYLGHKNIQHTVRYTDMAPDRFKNFWRA